MTEEAPTEAIAAENSSISTESISEENGENPKEEEQIVKNGNHEEPTEQVDDQPDFDEEREALVTISGFSLPVLRSLRSEIEDVIKNAIKKMELSLCDNTSHYTSLKFYKNFIIDRMGHQIKAGETGITEGWPIPRYENEYQNLLGLPFTEDHAMSETLRRARPRNECFNCLATNHRIQDCPVKLDEERIASHRKLFNVQAIQHQEQAQLFSNRYTKDQDGKLNRGFTPGKISDQLREALGLRPNQLPPFIYYMRRYGYPIGWLIEAQVKKTNLAVHNGDQINQVREGEGLDNSIIESEANQVEYDPELIWSIPGFNMPLPEGFIDETDRYHVPRYSSGFSRDNFLKTLPLKEKKKIGRRSMVEAKGADSETEEGAEEEAKPKSRKRKSDEMLAEGDSKDDSIEEGEADTTASSNDTKSLSPDADDKFSSPKKRKTVDLDLAHGTSFTEILGTPIVMSQAGSSSRVPDWEKFSDGICPHKPYEMDTNTPIGSYKSIVKLTRDFKEAQADD